MPTRRKKTGKMKPWYVQMTIFRLSKCDYLWLRGLTKMQKIPDFFEKPRTQEAVSSRSKPALFFLFFFFRDQRFDFLIF
jgi:hypothetical protein